MVVTAAGDGSLLAATRAKQRADAVRAMAVIRWFGLVFALVQIETFYETYPPGAEEAALSLTAGFAVGNLILSLRSRTGRPDSEVQRLAVPSLMLDLFALTGFVFVYTFDPETSIWALLYILPLEGALLFQRRGAFAMMGAATILYVARELFGSFVYDVAFLPFSITFRMGIGFIIAAVAGAMSSNLVVEQERLSVSERRFRSLVQNSADAIAVAGPDTQLGYVSESITEVTGYTPEELMGEIGFDFVHPDDLPMVAEMFQEVIGTPRARNEFTMRSKTKSGRWALLEVRLQNFLHDEAICGVVANLRDITAREQAEANVRESETRKAAILESALDCIITADAEGRIIDFNPAAEETFGYDRKDVVGRLVADVVVPSESRDAHLAGWRRYLQTGEAKIIGQRVRLVAERRNGQRFPVELAITHTSVGSAPLFTAYIRDVSEREHLEAELRQAQKMEAVGQLAGGIAHDFNNLLSVILNYTAFLEEDLADDDQRREDLAEITKAAQRGANLVRQLLAYSRKEVVSPEALSPTQVVGGMSRLLRSALGEGIEFSTDLRSKRFVLIDRTQLEQILMNLTINARDAGADLMTISSRDVEVDNTMAGDRPGLRPGDYVVLTVSDTGAGMASGTVGQIFDPFFTTKGKGVGTGLGLSTVYGLIKQASGYIQVDTAPNRGTVFDMFLPAVEAQQPQPPIHEPPPRASHAGGAYVLVVEDEPGVRTAAERILSRVGYEVSTAPTAQEALEVAAIRTPDLIVSDVVLPGLSGREMVEELQRRGISPPVLYMSGYDEHAIAAGMGAGGTGDLLQKPFESEELLRRVAASLAGDQEVAPDPGLT